MLPISGEKISDFAGLLMDAFGKALFIFKN
jgi:hypothetical protein